MKKALATLAALVTLAALARAQDITVRVDMVIPADKWTELKAVIEAQGDNLYRTVYVTNIIPEAVWDDIGNIIGTNMVTRITETQVLVPELSRAKFKRISAAKLRRYWAGKTQQYRAAQSAQEDMITAE